mgnify:CR=1 FL=1
MNGIGPLLPLARDDQAGYYTLATSYKEQVQQNFKNLMLTAPGERVMNPNFGVGLRRFLFEPKKNAIPKIRQRIVSQVQKYMPYIKINKLLFDADRGDNAYIEDSKILSILIEYEVPQFNITSELILQAEGIN